MRKPTLFGRPRWQMTLLVVFIAQVLTAIGYALIFPFLPLYVESLGSTYGLGVELMAGLVIAVQGFTMMLAAPFWGAVADRYGRKLMTMRAQFGGALLLLMMALVTDAEQLIVLRAIQGFITGTVAANSALVAAGTPRDRIGFAMGTLQVGLWAGVAAGPVMGGLLADAYGFQMPFVITAVLLLISGVLIYVWVHEDFVPSPVTDSNQPGYLSQFRHVLSASGVSMLLFLRFLTSVGRSFIFPIAPLFVVSLLPPSSPDPALYAGLVISVSSATSTFTGVYFGRMGDRIGHRTILVWTSAASVLLYLPQTFVTDVPQLIFLQALTGIAAGGIISAPSALLARYTEPGEEGAVFGIDNSMVSGARAVAPLLAAGVAIFMGMRGTFAATALIFLVVAWLAFRYLPHDEAMPIAQPMPASAD